jgi:hypothetical protein
MEQSKRIVLETEPLQSEMNVQEIEPSDLMDFDEHGFKKAVQEINSGADFMQQLISNFLKLNVGPLELEEIPNLIDDPREFVFKAVTRENPVMMGALKVSSDKARDMVEMPEGFDQIELKLKVMRYSLPADPNEESGKMTVKNLLTKLEVNADGEIVVKPDIVEALRKRFELRAETPFAKAVFKASSALQHALNENKSEFTSQNAVASLMSNIFVFDSESREISINYKTILSYNRPLKHSAHGLPYRG